MIILHVTSDPKLYSGVSIKAFPKDADHGVIMEFLSSSGLDEKHKEDVVIKPNGSVSIMNLSSSECSILISAIHQNDKFGRKLFCNGIIPLTPEKPGTPAPTPPPMTSAPATSPATVLSTAAPVPLLATVITTSSTPGTPISSLSSIPGLVTSKTSLTTNVLNASSPDQSLLDFGASSVITELDKNLDLLSSVELIRRHSLSMRDIPTGSLADEIMNPAVRKKGILDDIKDLTRKLSDFESCQSSLSSSGSSSEDSASEHSELISFPNLNSKKRDYKKKRKASRTPKREDFLKKQHKSSSPQGTPN